MEADQAVTQTLADYYRAFSTLQLDQITPFFHQPALIMAPGGLAAVPDAAALASIFAPTIQDLRARNYGRSEYLLNEVKQMNSTTASAQGIAIRFKSDGQELERVGITYLLHCSEARWRIAVMVVESA